jgi:hypothetical protein
MKIIIDKIFKYNPLLLLSKIDTFEIDLRKYQSLYILIDTDMNYFYSVYKNYPIHTIFILDKNIKIKKDLDVEYFYAEIDKEYDFKDKILKHKFIKEFIYN